MRIYLASSWRNVLQPGIVHLLRGCGHEVYDFRNPAPGNEGFSWSEIDPEWRSWQPHEYAAALEHPIAKSGFDLDVGALQACEACVLLLPSGRSASWEFGYALGQGKVGAVVMLDACEPELMYLGNPILSTVSMVFDWAVKLPGGHDPDGRSGGRFAATSLVSTVELACADLRADPATERVIKAFRERGRFDFTTLTEAQAFADVLERCARAVKQP